ncbi:MAG: hypothetical protein MMC23_005123 [Stictis urceolatum]|nr:hypothetical protein [Stictis urceolata]
MTTPIPQPPGIPLLGNIFDITPADTWTSLTKLWERYGEIFKISVLGQQIVFVGSVALAQEICDERRFRKFVGGPVVEIRYAVHDSLFTAYEDEASWGIHHRVLAPHLSPSAVSPLFTEIRDCAGELTQKWKGASHDKRVAVIGELNRLDLETTTLCFYGQKLNNLEGKEHPMIAAMDGATGEAVKRPTRPGLVNWLFYGGKFKRDSKAMRDYARECLSYRRDYPTDKQDLLWAMINAKDPETGKGLTEEQIIDEIVTMPIGSSTAPCAIAAAIYYLAKNPECVDKAREEIDAVVRKGEFAHEHLDDLKYCEGIMRETMRLSAPAPGFNIEPRPETKGPVTIGGGKYQIPEKQTMIIVLHGVNRDPAVFEEPEAFRPERMVGEKFDALPNGAKKWFGNGKRACIGQHYAWLWNMVTLVTLIREVDFELADPGYQLRQQGWFNVRPVEFFVKTKPRAM